MNEIYTVTMGIKNVAIAPVNPTMDREAIN